MLTTLVNIANIGTKRDQIASSQHTELVISMVAQLRAPLSWTKKVVFSGILILIVWVILDIGIYIALLQFSKEHAVVFSYQIPSREKLNAFYQQMHHPVWGWDIPQEQKNNLGGRRGRTHQRKDTYKIKLFGDSFVYALEVENHEAFPHLIEDETGWDALNFGVVGYGTDQALLKYKDTSHKSEYTVLGILDENIARCGNVWQGFYHVGSNLYWPKPRYLIGENEQVKLFQNLAKTRSDLMRFADAEFVRSLEKYDYWANYYGKLNAPRNISWPVSTVLLRHMDFFLEHFLLLIQRGMNKSYETELGLSRILPLYEDDEMFAIMTHIVDEFVRTANDRGETPIVLIFQTERGAELATQYNRRSHQRLNDYMEHRNIHYIDMADTIANKDYEQYYVPRRSKHEGGHYSAKGNQTVAREIIDFITALEGQ